MTILFSTPRTVLPRLIKMSQKHITTWLTTYATPVAQVLTTYFCEKYRTNSIASWRIVVMMALEKCNSRRFSLKNLKS